MLEQLLKAFNEEKATEYLEEIKEKIFESLNTLYGLNLSVETNTLDHIKDRQTSFGISKHKGLKGYQSSSAPQQI